MEYKDPYSRDKEIKEIQEERKRIKKSLKLIYGLIIAGIILLAFTIIYFNPLN